ncbi:MAG: hypothetical protein QM753_10870 [Thermomicrobiales bacterium]
MRVRDVRILLNLKERSFHIPIVLADNGKRAIGLPIHLDKALSTYRKELAIIMLAVKTIVYPDSPSGGIVPALTPPDGIQISEEIDGRQGNRILSSRERSPRETHQSMTIIDRSW